MDTIAISAAIILGVWLAMIAAIDFRTLRIPNAMSLPLIPAGWAFSYFRSALPFLDHLVGGCAGYLVLALIGWGYFRLREHEGLGLGDAKLFGAAGAWVGWAALPFVLVVACVAALLFALAARKIRSRIAFAPHLAVAFWLVWVFGAPLMPPVWR